MLKQNIMVNEMGLNCLSWNKSQVDRMMIVVGCKDARTTHKKTVLAMTPEETPVARPTLQFLVCEEKGWVPLIFPFNETESVNDVSWSLMNGRSYHLVASATDVSVRIFYLRIEDKSLSVIIDKSRELMGCGMRLSWNVMSTQLAVSEPKRIKLYKS